MKSEPRGGGGGGGGGVVVVYARDRLGAINCYSELFQLLRYIATAAMKAALAVACWLFVVAACRAGGGEGQLRFMVIGDWGGQPTYPYTTDAEKEVAAQMGKTAAAIGSQFTVALGDNFYDSGVKDVDDPRFQETFEVKRNIKYSCHSLNNCNFSSAEIVHCSSPPVPLVRGLRQP